MKPRGMMVIHQFRPIMNGAELQAERLAIKLIERGHPMQVFTELRVPGSLSEEDLQGVQVHRVPFPIAYQVVVNVAETLRYLVQNRHTYDILHVHQAFGHAIVSIVVARVFRKKCIVKIACAGEYGDLSVFSRFVGFQWAIRVLRQADYIVAISREVEAELLRWNFPPKRILRIPNGVDSEFFKRSQPFPPRAPVRFVLIGRRHPQKGIDIALRACKLLAEQDLRGQFEIKLYGDDYREYDYRSLAQELGITDCVEFLPHNPAILDILHLAHGLILPSRGEGMSNVLLECMSFEMPVIASKVSGSVDIVDDGVNGILIPPESRDALADAMATIIRDPDRATRLGQNARQKVMSFFSLDSVAQQYSELYTRLSAPRAVGAK
jgi:glycosyltransferase involved in cell wall biosynthesis